MQTKRYVEPYGVFGAMVGDVERPTPSYMVTVQGGTLQDGRTQGSYPAGSTITVTYTARPGYRFDYWRIEGVSDHITDNPYTFTLTRPMSLVASEVQQFTLQLEAGDRVTSVTGAGTYDKGQLVDVSCSMTVGSIFDGWYDGASLFTPHQNATISVNEDLVLVAKAHAGTIIYVGGIRGTQVDSIYVNDTLLWSEGDGDKRTTVEKNSQTIIRAELNEGRAFDGWYDKTTAIPDNLVSTDNPYTFTATGNYKSFYANDKVAQYTLQLEKDSHTSTVTGAGVYNAGTVVNISASLAIGYIFDGWYEGDTLVSAYIKTSITMTRDITLTVKSHEGRELYLGRYENSNLGDIYCNDELVLPVNTNAAEVQFEIGVQVTVRAALKEGRVFKGWYQYGTGGEQYLISTDNPYTFTPEKKRTTLYANDKAG